MTLQPLVENALYHGLKPKRGGGTITVRARKNNNDEVLIEVEDDGVGCTPYGLGKIQEEINSNNDEITLKDSGFGLANVSKRIKLYYGQQYGLAINSQYHVGTQITVTIPAK